MIVLLLVIFFYMPGPSKSESVYTCDLCLASNLSCSVPVDSQGNQLDHGRKEYVGSGQPTLKGSCGSFNIYRLHPSDPYD